MRTLTNSSVATSRLVRTGGDQGRDLLLAIGEAARAGSGHDQQPGAAVEELTLAAAA